MEPGDPADLAGRNPASRLGLGDKVNGQARSEELLGVLDGLHNRLWAEARRSVVLVLQGMDAAGKDGTIRRVLTGLNPQGCSVVNFKVPTDVDLAHDYLWRVHAAAPARRDPRRLESLALRGRRRGPRASAPSTTSSAACGTATSGPSNGCCARREPRW